MATIDDGGPAYPVAEDDKSAADFTWTKRELYAMAAMQGMLAYSYCSPATGNYNENCSVDGVAAHAFKYADAMLRASKLEATQ